MSEISSQTTLGHLSVTDYGSSFQGHDTTRNDNAHFCRASRLVKQLVNALTSKSAALLSL